MAGPGFTALFGGGNIYQANPSFLSLNPLAVDVTLSWPIEQSFATPNVAEIIEVVASVPGLKIHLTDATQTTSGYTSLFNNVGVNSFQVVDAGGNVLMTVASGQAWQLYLADNTTVNGLFRTFQFGAGVSNANAAALAGAGLMAIGITLNEKMDVHEFNVDYNVLLADRATFQVWNGGVGNLLLPGAPAVGSNWFVSFKNAGTGNVSVTATGGANIDGASLLVVPPGSSTFFITDGVSWFTLGFGQTINSIFDFIQIDVSGTGDFVLTAAQQNRVSYRFTGVLSGARNIIVPNTIQQYWVDNETTGAPPLTVKTAAGTGVIVPQTARQILYCDSVNVVAANTAGAITFLSGSAALPGITFTADTSTGFFLPAAHVLGFSSNGLERARVDGTGHWTVQSPDTSGVGTYTFRIEGPLPNGSALAVFQQLQSSINPGALFQSDGINAPSLISIASSNAVVGTSDFSIFQLSTNDAKVLVRAAQALSLGTNSLDRLIIDSNGHVAIVQPSTAGGALVINGTGVANPALSINNSTNTGATGPVLTANKPGASTAIGAWLAITLGGTLFWIPAWSN